MSTKGYLKKKEREERIGDYNLKTIGERRLINKKKEEGVMDVMLERKKKRDYLKRLNILLKKDNEDDSA